MQSPTARKFILTYIFLKLPLDLNWHLPFANNNTQQIFGTQFIIGQSFERAHNNDNNLFISISAN